MSQPVALIAKIKIGEPAFKRFLLGKHAKLLAHCIDAALDHQYSDYYVFRYLKAEQAVFAFFYFNHGNADSLAGSTELSVLKALAPVTEPGMAGHVLCCLDAMNLHPDVLGPCTAIVDGCCVEGPSPSATEWLAWKKDCAKYFYKEAEKPFALNFFRSRIVDKSIVRRCTKLAEERRVKSVLQHLDKATFQRPLRFFGDYFYNGTFIYHQFGIATPLPELDPRSFASTPYGGADALHVVVGARACRADVASFRKLQKGELVYYKDSRHVWHGLTPLPQADAASFKLLSDHAAQDDRTLYFAGLCLSRVELGTFRFEPHGYYHCEKLLLAEHAVYMGDQRLPVDAASFEVIEAVPNETRGAAYSYMYVVQDRHGRYVLYRESDARGRDGDARLVRADDAARTLAEVKQQQRQVRGNLFADLPPRMRKDDTLAYADEFRAWAQVHFESAYSKYKYSPNCLYVPVNNYFHGAFHQKRYAEVLALYERIEPTAWLNPHLFHHTACCHAALGQLDAAISEVRKACVFGYAHLELLWADEDLQSLWSDTRFQALLAQFAGGELLAQPELLEAIDRLSHGSGPELHELDRFLVGLACRFRFEDPAVSPIEPARAALLRRVFRHHLRLVPVTYQADAFYALYRDHSLLHPLVHFQMLQELFRNAHRFGGSIDAEAMAACTECVVRLQRAVAAIAEPELREEVDGEISRDAFLRYVLQLAT